VDFLRSAAIKLAANSLFLDRPVLAPPIEEFAFRALQDMIEVMQQKAKVAAQEKAEEAEAKAEAAEKEGVSEVGKEKEKETETEKEKETEAERKMDIDDVGGSGEGEKAPQSRKRKRGEDGSVPASETNGMEGDGEKEGEESDESYAKRHLLLSFALCARKHSLLPQLVDVSTHYMCASVYLTLLLLIYIELLCGSDLCEKGNA